MKNIFKKILGIVLMSTPFWAMFWVVGKMFNQGIWAGFIIFLTMILMIVLVGCGFALVIIITQIGWKIYKGASFSDLMSKDKEL